jgi:hypothetical protein
MFGVRPARAHLSDGVIVLPPTPILFLMYHVQDEFFLIQSGRISLSAVAQFVTSVTAIRSHLPSGYIKCIAILPTSSQARCAKALENLWKRNFTKSVHDRNNLLNLRSNYKNRVVYRFQTASKVRLNIFTTP